MFYMERGKKILYVVTKSVWGGAQKYVYDLATNLPQDKFEVAVVTGGNGPLLEKLENKQIRVIKLYGVTKNVNFLQEVESLFSLLKILKLEKPDIVHLNSSKLSGLGATAVFIYKLLTFNFGLSTVFTAHGWPFNEDRNFIARGVIYFFSWLTALLADRVINITKNDYKQSLKFILLPRNKFIYIPNGISEQNFMPRAEARKILGLGEKQFIIGTIAELTKNKGLCHFIDAVNQMKLQITNYKLQALIIGDGEDKEKIKNQIYSLALQNYVVLAGFIQNAERYLKAFDVFVLPSIKEGLPYVLLEAMAAGLPVIASRIGGVPDLIEHGKNGSLITPKDFWGLATELEKMMSSPEKYKRLGEEAEKTIRTKFLFRDMLQKTIILYA